MFENLDDLKKWRKKGLSAECKKHIETGFVIGDYRYDCEVTDQLNYNSMLHLTNEDDSNTVDLDCTEVATGNRVTRQVTHTDMKGIAAAGGQHVYALRDRLKTAKTAVDNAANESEVNTVVF